MNPFEAAFQRLNNQQRRAVEATEGPVLVLAGPGTGKTQILSTRIAHIVQEGLAEPQNILALTFTNSGAKNMRERLVSLMGTSGYSVTCTTFHSFCGSVISENPDAFSHVSSVESAVSEVDKHALIEKILTENEFEHLRPAKNPFFNVKNVLSLISDYKREGHSPLSIRALAEKELEALEQDSELTKAEKTKREKNAYKNREAAEIYSEYDRLLHESGQYDFDDMILWVKDAFRSDPELLATYQEKFQYILVDEFQDTNQAQFDVIHSLLEYWGEQANIFAVGDPNQSIYRFQGASIANTLNFLEIFPQAEVITLREGYRCGQDIYTAAAAVIQNNRLGKEYAELEEMSQALHQPSGEKGKLYTHQAPNTLAECLWIAEEITQLKQKGVPLSEIAVLYRQHKNVRQLQNVLERLSLPYELDDGAGVLDHPLIVQFLSLLRLLVSLRSGQEPPQLVPVLQQSWWNLAPQDVLDIQRHAFQQRTSVWNFLSDRELFLTLKLSEQEKLWRIAQKFVEWQHLDGQLPLPQLVETILREAGVYAASLNGDIPLSHLTALLSLQREIQAWNQRHPDGKMAEWLDRLDRMRRHGIRLSESDLNTHSEAITLCTAHKAKGREWEHVFILHAHDQSWGNIVERNKLKPLPGTIPHAELDKKERNEDERRLFYVALTRAKKAINLCWSQTEIDADRPKELQRSQFIEEMSGQSLEEKNNFSAELLREKTAELIQTPRQSWLKSGLNRSWIAMAVSEVSFSATALQDYLQCPVGFFYKHVVRVPIAASPAIVMGNAVHGALEKLYRSVKEGEDPRAAEALPRLLKRVDEIIAVSALQRSEIAPLAARAKTIITDYYHENISPHAQIQSPLEVEKKFGSTPPLVFAGLRLVGKLDRIDIIAADEKTARVIDYKTGEPKSRNAIIGNTKESDGRYYRQLAFYELLAELDPTFPYKLTEGEINFVEKNASGKYIAHRFELTPELNQDLKNTLTTVKAEIDKLEFLERDPCGKCDTCKALGFLPTAKMATENTVV